MDVQSKSVQFKLINKETSSHMPYKTNYRESDGGVIPIYSGVVTDEELIQSVDDKLLPSEKLKSYR